MQKPVHAMPVLELIHGFLQDFARDALLRDAAVLGCNHASEGLQRAPCRLQRGLQSASGVPSMAEHVKSVLTQSTP